MGLEVHPLERGPAAHGLEPGSTRAQQFSVGARLGDKGMAFAHDHQGEMSQRSQVATRPHAALLRDCGDDAAIVHLNQPVDQIGRHAGIALGQSLNPQSQRQPADADAQQRPHADGVTAQQVLLERENFLRLDALVCQFAEAGVDAVDRGSLGQKIVKTLPGALDALPRCRG